VSGVTVTYTDRRGAGCARHFGRGATSAEVLALLRRVRSVASVRTAGADEPIGGVWDSATAPVDDRRVRWIWWLDEQACKRALEAA
jgi:hypothetical protein